MDLNEHRHVEIFKFFRSTLGVNGLLFFTSLFFLSYRFLLPYLQVQDFFSLHKSTNYLLFYKVYVEVLNGHYHLGIFNFFLSIFKCKCPFVFFTFLTLLYFVDSFYLYQDLFTILKKISFISYIIH